MAIASATHAADQLVIASGVLPVMLGEMSALVGMHQQMSAGQCQELLTQTEELRHLKTELKRVTEERDILKKAVYFAKQSE